MESYFKDSAVNGKYIPCAPKNRLSNLKRCEKCVLSSDKRSRVRQEDQPKSKIDHKISKSHPNKRQAREDTGHLALTQYDGPSSSRRLLYQQFFKPIETAPAKPSSYKRTPKAKSSFTLWSKNKPPKKTKEELSAQTKPKAAAVSIEKAPGKDEVCPELHETVKQIAKALRRHQAVSNKIRLLTRKSNGLRRMLVSLRDQQEKDRIKTQQIDRHLKELAREELRMNLEFSRLEDTEKCLIYPL